MADTGDPAANDDTRTDTEACPFFDKLPAEIRLKIYKLIFLPIIKYQEQSTAGDILDARPPEKAVLQTCRRAYAEARDTYKERYRHYWNSTQFVAFPLLITRIRTTAAIDPGPWRVCRKVKM